MTDLALNEGRISMAEFLRRAARAGHELREVNESLAKIGLRIGAGHANAIGGDTSAAAVATTVPKAPAKPKKKIVRFHEPPPIEFRRRLMREFGLTYDPEVWTWRGEADPAEVDAIIRSEGLSSLVRQFYW